MRVIVLFFLLVVIGGSVFAQGSIEGRTETDELAPPPLVVQAQGRMGQGLEGPVDPNTYILGPSDQLLLILRGSETTLEYLRIFPEGNVILPNYGAIDASGLTLAEFRDRVRQELRRFYRNVDIDCQLSVPRTFVVFVLGQVNAPGPVRVTALSRVSHAITSAKGLKGGTERRIEIRENGTTAKTVDLFKFWRLGDFEQNPTLKEGQTIFVRPKEMEVSVVGAVKLPGRYELLEGETAAELIAYCGGIAPLGDREHILRERIQNGRAL
ncbi:MAG: SLBB domain-containing protein, partial [Candidatus Krumholzibacteria bacterium]|nr:SLBB domain-containing protein [Candidatus Krumholzibacteria bacterium]